MSWSVRALLNFSFHPGINEAYEGGDSMNQALDPGEVSMCLGWLEDDLDDPNNNSVTPVRGWGHGDEDTNEMTVVN